MIEDAWSDFPSNDVEAIAFNEDVSALRLIALRHDGNGLYKDLRHGGYIVCSPEHKKQRLTEKR